MQGAWRDKNGFTDHIAARTLDRRRPVKADHDLRGEMAMGSGVAAEAFETGPILAEPNLT